MLKNELDPQDPDWSEHEIKMQRLLKLYLKKMNSGEYHAAVQISFEINAVALDIQKATMKVLYPHG